jgi:hypothetical protein
MGRNIKHHYTLINERDETCKENRGFRREILRERKREMTEGYGGGDRDAMKIGVMGALEY